MSSPPSKINRGERVNEENAEENATQKLSFLRYTSSSYVGLGIGAIFHPFLYAKTLIQLGHEPMPLERGKAYLCCGADTYFLPNVFKYIKHIKKTDGFTGLYTGVFSSLGYNFLGLSVSVITINYLNETYPDEIVTEAALRNETTGQAYSRFVKRLTKETISKALGIIVARPIQVVLIRRLAQFVGKETIYVTTLGSLRIIYNEEGARGLFAGLIPQLMGEMFVLWISSTLLFAFDRYWKFYVEPENKTDGEAEEEESEDDDLETGLTMKQTNLWKQVAHFIIPYLVTSFFYPFQLVSVVMAVNGSPLKIGQPPIVPIFLHWQDCWAHLGRERQLKRGSKLFFRNYEGPIDYRAGEVYARGPKKPHYE